jgi:hypothetical protein
VRLLGHVARIGNKINLYRVLVGKHEAMSLFKIYGIILEVNIKARYYRMDKFQVAHQRANCGPL